MIKITSFALFFVMFCPVYAYSEYVNNSDAAAKCESTEFINQSREFFACDFDWSLDSCKGMITSLAAIAGEGIGAAKPLSLTMDAKFSEFIRVQNAFFRELDYTSKESGELREMERTRKEWKRSYTEYEKKQYEQRLDKIIASEKKLRDYNNQLKQLERELKLNARGGTLRTLFRELTNAEVEYKRLTMERMAESVKFPRKGDYSSLVRKYAGAKENFENIREKLGREIAGKLARFQPSRMAKGSIKGWASGAVIGLAIESLPDLLNYVNSKTCEISKGQEEIRKYLHVSRSDDGCRVDVSTNDELNLLTKGPEERRKLFKKYPLLCQALVKKHESRLERLKDESVKVEFNSCRKDSKEAVVRINGRKYQYHLSEFGGKIEIKSALGHQPKEKESGNPVDSPVKATWVYAKNAFKPVELSVKDLDDYSLLGDGYYIRDLASLQQDYLDIDGKFKPLTPMTRKDFVSSSQRDIIGTMAEQSIALKRALPEILECTVAENGDTKRSQNVGQIK